MQLTKKPNNKASKRQIVGANRRKMLQSPFQWHTLKNSVRRFACRFFFSLFTFSISTVAQMNFPQHFSVIRKEKPIRIIDTEKNHVHTNKENRSNNCWLQRIFTMAQILLCMQNEQEKKTTILERLF